MNDPQDILPFRPPPPRETQDDGPIPDEIDDDLPWDFDPNYWDALLPEHDYEPLPEYGDFWLDHDAA